MSTGLLLRILNGHTSGVTSVQFTSDNTTLISGGYDKTIRYWNVADGTLLCTLTTDSSEVASVAISSDGRLLASGSADNRGHLCLTEDGLFPVSLSKHTGVVNAVVFTPNNTSCITASNDASVVIWKLTSEWTNMP
jgi:WD40 repeat protein